MAAQAQSTVGVGVEAQRFRPSLDPFGYLGLRGTELLEPWQPSFGLSYGYERNPVVLSGDTRVLDRVVSDVQTLDLLASVKPDELSPKEALELLYRLKSL